MIMTKVPRNRPGLEGYDEDNLGFGRIFTDHMLTMRYSDGEWQSAEITPLGNIRLHPAALVFHYGQQVFEGLKAFLGPKSDEILLFRPDKHIARFNRSCERLCIPTIAPDLFMDHVSALVRTDRDWIPRKSGTSLYIRPTVIATDPFVGVRTGSEYLFYIILSPVGANYPEGFEPVKIMVTDKYVRAWPGGVGEAKTASNYAASMLAGQEAHAQGFAQVLWLNGADRASIEEVGASSIFFRINDQIITPPLCGTILPGVTRDCVLQLARDLGYTCGERKVTIDQLVQAVVDGSLKEVFGVATGAVISPVSSFRYRGQDYVVADGKTGEAAHKLFDRLTAIQTGRESDPYGWVINIG